MLQVTQAYIDAMAAPVRDRGYARIFIGQYDDEAGADATLYSSGMASYGQLAVINSEVPVSESYVTWTGRGFRGDGVQRILPASGTGHFTQGFVSAGVSNANSTFYERPYIDVYFTAQRTMIGLTVEFDVINGIYPVGMLVQTYRGGTLVATKVVAENDMGPVTKAELYIKDVDRVVLLFEKTQVPCQCVHVTKLLFGIGYEYTDDDIISINMSESSSPLSLELPTSKLTFKLKNLDGVFNPERQNSRTSFLANEQRIQVEYGIESPEGPQVVNGGLWYLRSWDTKGLEASFTAGTVLDRLSDHKYEREVWNPNATLGHKLAAVIADSGIDPERFSYPEDVWEIRNHNPLPIVTHAEALQLIANCGGYQMRVDREGRLVLFRTSAEDNFAFSTADAATGYSRIEDINDAEKCEYATWERNFFPGDASQRILPSGGPFYDNGWVSQKLAYGDGDTVNIVASTASGLSTNVFSIYFDFGTAPPKRLEIYSNRGTPGAPNWVSQGIFTVEADRVRIPVVMRDVVQWMVTLRGVQAVPRRYHVADMKSSYVVGFTAASNRIFTPIYSEKPTRIANMSLLLRDYDTGEAAELRTTSVQENGELRIEHDPATAQAASVDVAGVQIRVRPYARVTYLTVSGVPAGAKARVTLTARPLVPSECVRKEKLFDSGDSMPMENPLYNRAGSDMVLYWTRQFALNQVQQKIDMRGNPELEVGDYIYLEDGKPGIITHREFKYSGAFMETLTVKRGEYIAMD